MAPVTCGVCDHVRGYSMAGLVVAVCSKRDGTPVVPSRSASREKTVTFWRVPLECPIYEGRSDRVPHAQQVTRSYESLEPAT